MLDDAPRGPQGLHPAAHRLAGLFASCALLTGWVGGMLLAPPLGSVHAHPTEGPTLLVFLLAAFDALLFIAFCHGCRALTRDPED